jgi:hypothetical protein
MDFSFMYSSFLSTTHKNTFNKGWGGIEKGEQKGCVVGKFLLRICVHDKKNIRNGGRIGVKKLLKT